MKKALLLFAIAAGLIVGCVKSDVLPVQSTTNIFQASSKMTHSKDTIRNSGDTVVYSVSGNIKDTSRKYSIAADVEAIDTTNQANMLAVTYYKSITVKFDTSGLGKSGLYHWTSSVSLYFPPVASKTGIKTTAAFTYGLSLSSQTGAQVATDSKLIHVK
jgi:hypothetical protein